HAGRIGDATPEHPYLGSRMGIGNTTFDIEVFSYDLGKAGGVPIPLPYPHNQGRGTINAVSDFEFLMAVRDFDTLDSTPFVKVFPAHASPGDQDPPAWHNTGSRPRVYMDGGLSADNTRALLQFLTASISTSTCSDAYAETPPWCGAWIKRGERGFGGIRPFLESSESPTFPRAIDPARPQYVDALNEQVTEETNGLLYTRAKGRCGCVGVYELSLGQFIGYAAPALHGLWSTAPYLHNGSVPTVYHVLRYGERPTSWRRPLDMPGTPPDQGFDVSLAAYDFAKVGWKFDCVLPDGTPVDTCGPELG